MSETNEITGDFPVSLLDYDIPDSQIAQIPLENRDESKLLLCNRTNKTIEHHIFRELPDLLPPQSTIVLNTSKVFPAKVMGIKETEGKVEILFLREIESGKWRVIFSRRARMPEGRKIFLFNNTITATLIERIDDGKDILEIDKPELFRELLNKSGLTPLPQYITNLNIDPERYQTVYADNPGSAAAPTAGLHFTENTMKELNDSGFRFAKLELQIGLDTFSPIRTDNLKNHIIHTERGIIPPDCSDLINETRDEKKSLMTVGTTSTRLLEYVACKFGKIQPFDGDVDLFITPGYEFKIVDHLLTNFHLPRTTLLALVGAFMGLEFMFEAYSKAMENNYRFYSFGDAMLII
ncbi:tRNA preQ1(34) S-adenosylmethionine ribosyltransferase-isomerase QueA [bacterium]|nr:tRNA preQ1(34) S-adenosylmethionine ribosyltransferase-isomerase QueA [bacterium]MBU1024969.1 tRNA preQ1(34) S-adenosylmethionine ribosyltransferase-isomerase QueA [bacterium]